MTIPRLPSPLRLLLRALLGLGATTAAVLGYAALLTLAVQAGQPLSGIPEGAARNDRVELSPQHDLVARAATSPRTSRSAA